MTDKGFGSDLWKNMQALKLNKHGAIEAPIRANGKDGIVVGVDAVKRAETGHAPASTTRPWWKRLLRRT
ncbi:hypothetical protein [Nocardioides silvaticus]|uniref:hypothetical protein n=1 Tax=Nocardioides silvaticus TaxID=2201891 RepID=UPI0011B1D316|nr:hypothetical protein [Nocardioides silvaticus]